MFLGVIGGMGPLAGADFLHKLAARTEASRDQDHVPVLLWGDCRIPDRTEYLQGRGPSPSPALQVAAQGLERSGAKGIAIPCNTAHAWVDDIDAVVEIPVLHMPDAVMDSLSSRSKLGILATNGTRISGTYDQSAARHGVELLWPTMGDQERIMSAVTLAKSGRWDESSAILAAEFDKLLNLGADMVALSCTEFPIALSGYRTELAIDPTAVLADRCIKWWFGQVPPNDLLPNHANGPRSKTARH